jgi:hypothetical protein
MFEGNPFWEVAAILSLATLMGIIGKSWFYEEVVWKVATRQLLRKCPCPIWLLR